MEVRKSGTKEGVFSQLFFFPLQISKYLRNYARTIHGKQQLIINAYARALETIPRTIAQNAGLDRYFPFFYFFCLSVYSSFSHLLFSVDVLNKLRHKHAQGGLWFGVDVVNGGVCDTFKACIWEPVLVKTNALTAATEAACLILSIDETIKNPRNDQNEMQ